MNNQPIALDPVVKDSFLHEIVRKSFRVPVNHPGKFWVGVNTNRYPIRDICLDGVGITLEDPTGFAISQTVMNCELNIAQERIKGLNGRVIHFSLNSGKDWQLGVQWIAISKQAAGQIYEVVTTLKKELFSGDQYIG